LQRFWSRSAVGIHDHGQSCHPPPTRTHTNTHRVTLLVFIPTDCGLWHTILQVPRGGRLAGLARHLTGLVSDDGTSTHPQVRASVLENDQRHQMEPDYDTTPPILYFANADSNNGCGGNRENVSGGGGSKHSGRVRSDHVGRRTTDLSTTPETVLFGLYMLVPIDNTFRNTSMVAWRAGTGESAGYNVIRQFWSTSVPVCGQWWSTGCNERFNMYGARCSTERYTRACYWLTCLLVLSEHACGQWHSTLVFPPLTGLHCKFRPHSEGIRRISARTCGWRAQKRLCGSSCSFKRTAQ
jgi:hypothetical protein